MPSKSTKFNYEKSLYSFIETLIVIYEINLFKKEGQMELIEILDLLKNLKSGEKIENIRGLLVKKKKK